VHEGIAVVTPGSESARLAGHRPARRLDTVGS